MHSILPLDNTPNLKISEAFLHFIWKTKQFAQDDLTTSNGQPVQIINWGTYNTDGGPDFSHAKIIIEETIWIGHVELHVQGSDWFRHKHHLDKAYNNVILHVVWVHDKMAYTQNENAIPTIAVKMRINASLINKYEKLKNSKSWIPCASLISGVKKITVNSWLDRLMVARLNRKVNEVEELMRYTKGDFERSFFILFMKYFGMKVNRTAFKELGMRVSPLVLYKYNGSLLNCEAMLFGQGGFLEDPILDEYSKELRDTFLFMKKKHRMQVLELGWKYLRMRPTNFPSFRLAQFAAIISQRPKLFSDCLEVSTVDSLKKLLTVQMSMYWSEHYRLGHKSNSKISPGPGLQFIRTLAINVVVPFQYFFGRYTGNVAMETKAFIFLRSMKAEKNTVIKNWGALNLIASDAADSQALLELKQSYCDKKRCLECRLGKAVLFENGKHE